jgi:Flp pilus assembly protein TadG
VLLTPILFVLIFSTVQFALYFFARHVVQTATQEALNTARDEAAAPGVDWRGDTQATGLRWIQNLAPSLVTSPTVDPPVLSSQDGVETVQVTITAKVPSWLGTITVTQTATGPVEQFYSDTGD